MPTDLQAPNATEITQTGLKLMELTQRAVALSAKSQARSLAKATGEEYSLTDAETLAKAYGQFWSGMFSDPQKFWAAQLKAGTSIARIWETMLTSSMATQDDNAPRDRRFSGPDWSEDRVARVYRDVFLALEDSVGELLGDLTEDSKDDMRVNFYTRQMLSALSPSNYLSTNPTARAEMIESHGASVLDGIENLLNDLERGDGRLDIATNDENAFEVGIDLATTEGEVVFQNELMQLIQYHPRTAKQRSKPILFAPAWINKFYILDMQEKNSLIRYMLERGHSVFVISWVNPTKAHAELDFSDYMKLGPLTALDVMRDITGEERANILGFCIGGILVTATLAYLAAKGDDRIAAATTLATMVDFKDVGEIGVFIDLDRLTVLRGHMEEKGYLEAFHLQDMFSMLREKDLIWSFFEASYLRGKKPRAFDLLYWNSDSTRLPSAMLLWYLEKVYLENGLRKPGGLEMNGVKLDVTKIKTPCFVLATEDDHIAPWTSVYPTTQLLGGDVEFVLGGSGHIAGVINPPAKRQKYGYQTAGAYPESSADFLNNSQQHEGSWWPHWAEWLEAKDGEMVDARTPAKRGRYKSIEAAPGSYVKAR